MPTERHGAAHRIKATKVQDQSGHHQKTQTSDSDWVPTKIDWSKEPKGLGDDPEDFDPRTGKITRLY